MSRCASPVPPRPDAEGARATTWSMGAPIDVPAAPGPTHRISSAGSGGSSPGSPEASPARRPGRLRRCRGGPRPGPPTCRGSRWTCSTARAVRSSAHCDQGPSHGQWKLGQPSAKPPGVHGRWAGAGRDRTHGRDTSSCHLGTGRVQPRQAVTLGDRADAAAGGERQRDSAQRAQPEPGPRPAALVTETGSAARRCARRSRCPRPPRRRAVCDGAPARRSSARRR